MKMKVCHVTSVHNRFDGRIFLKQCSTLAKNGYDVTLLCCDDKPNEIINNVSIISINRKFKSILDRFFNAKRLLKKRCIEIDADIYQFHDPDLLSLALYMKRKGKKIIFDSHEDYPALFYERKWIPILFRRSLSYLYKLYETYIFKKIDYIICVADYQKSRIKKINFNVDIITNYPILDTISKTNIKSNKNILCFAGGVRSDWNHDVIINSISNLKNTQYVVAGNYKPKYLLTLKKLNGFSKTKFLGKINFNEVKNLYSSSNIGMAICSYRPNTGYKLGSLGITKIFEYMMYELPVIFTDFDVFKKILDEGTYGIAVNPYSVEEVNSAIKFLIDNPNIAINMGKMGRKLVEKKYNWNTQIPTLLFIYKKLGVADDKK